MQNIKNTSHNYKGYVISGVSYATSGGWVLGGRHFREGGVKRTYRISKDGHFKIHPSLLIHSLKDAKDMIDEILKKNMKQAVCALIYTDNGKILCVSRKDDHSSFGLVGGKVDDGETPEEALYRETFEETGLTIITHKKIFERIDGDFICFTYLCTVKGEVTTDNEISELKGIVKELTWDELFAGPFGQYNLELFNHINNENLKSV
jgi:8-oxo-dGTP pyrophosphatase MutT (NUDIX family)